MRHVFGCTAVRRGPAMLFRVMALATLVFQGLSLSAPQHGPVNFMGINVAHAQGEGGDGGEGPSAHEPKTILRVTVPEFLRLTRNELHRLEEKNNRADTTVFIEGFPQYASASLIEAGARDRRTIRTLLRRMSTVRNGELRARILKRTLKRYDARYDLLNGDVQRLSQELADEEYRARRDPTTERTRSGRPLSSKLTALRQALDEARLRRGRAGMVQSFLRAWNKDPGMGQ